MRPIDATLVPQLLEYPPDGLHEVGVHRLVVVVEVDPAPHTRYDRAPIGDVAQDHRATLLVEVANPVLANVGSPIQAEGILRQILDGQAVAIPAEAAFDVVPTHRPIARHDVLDRAR